MLEQRARGSELLDRPDADPRLVERSYRLMRSANRAGGGIRIVRRFLERELATSTRKGVVRVLDIGSGDCDIPLAVAQWAKERGYDVAFTCLDHDAKAFEIAQEAIKRGGCDTVRLEKADVFSYRPAHDFDYAIASMCFHHFTNEQIGGLIERLRGFVRTALLINDLHRCLLNDLACRVRVLPEDREIRHDALLSIRRGFKPAGLAHILREHDPAAVVRRAWFCRLAGVVRFDRKGGT